MKQTEECNKKYKEHEGEEYESGERGSEEHESEEHESEESDSEGLDSEESDSEEEVRDYKRGGFHPVKLGNRFSEKRYTIVEKMGNGRFSTVWMAWDAKQEKAVALKIPQARYSKSTKEEIDVLKKFNNPYIGSLIGNFTHCGPNGMHTVIVLELLGPTLKTLLKNTNYKGLNEEVVKNLSVCILNGLDHIHGHKLIHSDLKPENILCVFTNGYLETIINEYKEKINNKTSESCKTTVTEKMKNTDFIKSIFKISDFGNAVDKYSTSDVIQTRNYRCPEVILKSTYSTSADIWSVGCIVFEAATSDILFYPEKKDYCSCNEHHLSLMIKKIGKIPRKIYLSGTMSKLYFDKNGNLRNIPNINIIDMKDVLINKYDFDEDYAQRLKSFIMPMFNFCKIQRAKAEDMLKHNWIREVVIN